MVIWEGAFADIPCEYRYRTVTNIEYSDGVAEITVSDVDSSKKFWFNVFTSGEATSNGYVKLTMEDAILVSKVVNKENWFALYDESYSGSFAIDLSSAVDAETFEECNNGLIPEEIMNVWR
jgi:cell wall assembly regulator SMI1